MKPNFALKLSHDGIEILQRAASGWIVIGSTRFDTADLDDALRRLRVQAEALVPEGIRSKLILPESEVRYATVVAPGPTDEARRLQVEAEIEGLTPYALHELAYDFVVEGDHALVAICARETLAEAEGFAQTHGFNPVSFVAIPASGAFSGEPFFGETSGARAFMSRNASVERDSEPVRIVPPARLAEPVPPALRPAAPAPV
ncbi:MAG TPA: translation initiation factor 2, partial [Paracoccus sp.]|nr:translation initiation factor 2 [Paracoccus sp. (in: a-proteobacteria)]